MIFSRTVVIYIVYPVLFTLSVNIDICTTLSFHLSVNNYNGYLFCPYMSAFTLCPLVLFPAFQQFHCALLLFILSVTIYILSCYLFFTMSVNNYIVSCCYLPCLQKFTLCHCPLPYLFLTLVFQPTKIHPPPPPLRWDGGLWTLECRATRCIFIQCTCKENIPTIDNLTPPPHPLPGAGVRFTYILLIFVVLLAHSCIYICCM